MNVEFCLDALMEAIIKYGVPAIFNTDAGSQYTSKEFTSFLESYEILISMDGIGRCLDNVRVLCEVSGNAKVFQNCLAM